MKKILFLFLLITNIATASNYYVATNGNDNNAGTINSPFLSWQKGSSVLIAGDVLYIRGGVYKSSGVNSNNSVFGFCGVYLNGKSGTVTNPIVITNYSGEVPILDCINITQPGVHSGIILFNCNYITLRGLDVRNAKQLPGTASGKGIMGFSVNNCIFEKLTGHDNGGSGVCIKWDSDNNLVLNCDGYNNVDPYTAGDDADGIEVSFIQYRAGNPRTNTIKGCRGWHNSDDGIDCYSNEGILTIDNCWTWGNGAYMGIGSGIKIGSTNHTEYATSGILQRAITNNISAYNDAYGFANNNTSAIVQWTNNISFHHVSPSASYVSYGFERWNNNFTSEFKNNISLEDQSAISGTGTGTGSSVMTGNSWQSGYEVTRDSFFNVDTMEFKLPRKSDGSLPDISAFKRKSVIPPVEIPVNDTIRINVRIEIIGNKLIITNN